METSMDKKRFWEEQAAALEAKKQKVQQTGVFVRAVKPTIDTKEAFQKSDMAQGLTGRTLTEDQKYEQAYKLVVEHLKQCRRFVTADEIREATKQKSEVPVWRVHGIDLEEVKHPKSARSLKANLIRLSEEQSQQANSLDGRMMERILYNPHTDAFKWKGQYDELTCKDDILDHLETADAEARDLERECNGIEASKIRGCYSGAEKDIVDLVNSGQVYAITRRIRRDNAKTPPPTLDGNIEATSSASAPSSSAYSQKRLLTIEALDNTVLFYKDPLLAKAVEGVDEKLKEIWRSIRPLERGELTEKIKTIPAISQKALLVVDDTFGIAQRSSDAAKPKREGNWRIRIKNTHMEGFDFSKPFDPTSSFSLSSKQPTPSKAKDSATTKRSSSTTVRRK